MDQKLALLAKVPLLAGLGRKDLEQVGRLADEVELPAGKVAARQGASADEFFVIIDGTVRIERDGQHLRDLGPGDFFGELAMLGKMPRTATATCVTACRMLLVGHREFNALLSSFPSIQGAVLHAVAQRIANHEPEQAHWPDDPTAVLAGPHPARTSVAVTRSRPERSFVRSTTRRSSPARS